MKLSSLTYLSFNLERLVMHSTADLQSPFITVSVHDSRGRRVSFWKLSCCSCDVQVFFFYFGISRTCRRFWPGMRRRPCTKEHFPTRVNVFVGPRVYLCVTVATFTLILRLDVLGRLDF